MGSRQLSMYCIIVLYKQYAFTVSSLELKKGIYFFTITVTIIIKSAYPVNIEIIL